MSGEKWTAGPWNVGLRTGAAAGMYGHCVSASVFSTPGVVDGRDAVAEVRGLNQDANARLIAAAPDMAEALEAIALCDVARWTPEQEARWSELSGRFVTENNGAMNWHVVGLIARAALAKARGER